MARTIYEIPDLLPIELVRCVDGYVDYSDYLSTAQSNADLLRYRDICSPLTLDLSGCACLNQTTLWALLEKVDQLQSLSIPKHLKEGILFAISYMYGAHTVRATALLLSAPGVLINATRYDPEPDINEDRTPLDVLDERMRHMQEEIARSPSLPEQVQLERLKEVRKLFLAHGAIKAMDVI